MYEQELLAAVKNGAAQELRILISKGADIRATNAKRRNVFHLLAISGNVHIMKDLIEYTSHIISITSTETDFITVLALSQPWGQPRGRPLIKDLIRGRAAQDKHGRTPLHYAAKKGRIPIIQLLFAQDSSLNAYDKRGHTPLMLAITAGKTEAAQILYGYSRERSTTAPSLPNTAQAPMDSKKEYRHTLFVQKTLLASGITRSQPQAQSFSQVYPYRNPHLNTRNTEEEKKAASNTLKNTAKVDEPPPRSETGKSMVL